MNEEIRQWQRLRNELDDMLKARNNMKYAEAVQEYYKKFPKDNSEKKKGARKGIIPRSFDEDGFSYENSVEKRYWRKRPKNPTAEVLEKDHPELGRITPAIAFFEKLKDFIKSLDCPKPEQWIVEKKGQEFMDRFRKNVLLPLKEELENKQYDLLKDENGRDEFDF